MSLQRINIAFMEGYRAAIRMLIKLGFKALVERYNSESKWYA